MPCNTIQRSSVSLDLKADNHTLLVEAMKALGWRVDVFEKDVIFNTPEGLTGNFVDGKLKLAGRREYVESFDLNPLKREYSKQIVTTAAKRFGWSLEKKSDTKLKAKRRY